MPVMKNLLAAAVLAVAFAVTASGCGSDADYPNDLAVEDIQPVTDAQVSGFISMLPFVMDFNAGYRNTLSREELVSTNSIRAFFKTLAQAPRFKEALKMNGFRDVREFLAVYKNAAMAYVKLAAELTNYQEQYAEMESLFAGQKKALQDTLSSTDLPPDKKEMYRSQMLELQKGEVLLKNIAVLYRHKPALDAMDRASLALLPFFSLDDNDSEEGFSNYLSSEDIEPLTGVKVSDFISLLPFIMDFSAKYRGSLSEEEKNSTNYNKLFFITLCRDTNFQDLLKKNHFRSNREFMGVYKNVILCYTKLRSEFSDFDSQIDGIKGQISDKKKDFLEQMKNTNMSRDERDFMQLRMAELLKDETLYNNMGIVHKFESKISAMDNPNGK